MNNSEDSDGGVQKTPRLVIDVAHASTNQSESEHLHQSLPVKDGNHSNTTSNNSATDEKDQSSGEGWEGQESKGYVSDFFETTKKKDDDKSSLNDVTRHGDAMSPASKRRMSVEEITKSYEQLGLQRCPYCKFTTSHKELFTMHVPTCRSKLQKPGKSDSPVTAKSDPAVTAKSDQAVTATDPATNSGDQISKAGDQVENASTDEETFLTFSYLKDTEEFSCLRCKMSWTDKGQFEEHVVCHTTNLPYICLSCKRNFASRYLLESHSKKEHPQGGARCGLKGIKRGRKVVEDLMIHQKLIIIGKPNIPATPNLIKTAEKLSAAIEKPVAQQTSIQTSSEMKLITTSSGMKLTNVMVLPAPSPVSVNVTATKSSPTVDKIITLSSTVMTTDTASKYLISSTGKILPISAGVKIPQTAKVLIPKAPSPIISQSVNVQRTFDTKIVKVTAPMPLATSSKHTVSLGQTLGANQFKQEHLNSLFGVLNPETKEIEPTNVSTKIQKIATAPSSISSVDPGIKEPQYHVKHITNYTTVPDVKPVNTASLGGPFVLIPVTPFQTGQLISTAGIQSPVQVMPAPQVLYTQNKPTTVISPPGNQHRIITDTVKPAVSTQNTAPNATTIVNRTGFPVTIKYQTPPPEFKQPPVGTSMVKPVVLQPPSQHEMTNRSPQDIAVRPNRNQGNLHGKNKKFLFRIKLGQGFVCEECKKFTKDEFVFRKHAWEHFHGIPLACRYCSPERIRNKDILACQLVHRIVCNLVKSSAHKTNQTEMTNPPKIVIDGNKEVIDITDDEENSNVTEVIVIEDEDENGDGSGLQIKIIDSYSLAMDDLEVMNKKTDDSMDMTDERNKNSVGNEEMKTLKEKVPEAAIPERDLANSDLKANDVSDQQKSTKGYVENEDKKEKTHKETKEINEKETKEICEKENKDISEKEGKENNEDKKEITNDDDKEMEIEDKEMEKEKDLINKSLNQPDEEKLTTFISKILDSKFCDYDPTSKTSKTDHEAMDIEIDAVTADDTTNIMTLSSAKSDVASKVNEKVSEFDNATISKHGHNAFYMCGYEDCRFVCLSSHNYRDHLKSEKHEKEYCYVCGHCGQKDYVEDGHVRHLFSHANVKRFGLYKCPIRLCKYKTNLINMYQEHVKAHQKEELTIKCTYCHKSFPTVESLVDHLRQNLLKFVTCPYCSFKFVNKYVVANHIKLSHPDRMRMVSVSSQIVCNEREINFYVTPKVKKMNQGEDTSAQDIPDTANLDITAILEEVQNEKEPDLDRGVSDKSDNEHEDSVSLPEEDQEMNVAAKHEKKQDKPLEKGKGNKEHIHDFLGPKSLQCHHCSFLSYNQTRHAQHMSLHSKKPEREKRYVCNLCPKGQTEYSKFKTHMENHVGKNEIKLCCCTMCAFSSNLKSHIMDHCRDAHQPESMYTLKTEIVTSSESSCKYCQFKSRTPEHVFQHELLVHKIKPVVSVEPIMKEPPKMKADKTKDLADSRELMTNHPNENDTSESKELETSEYSGKKRKYHCDYCKSYFKHKQNLKDHMTNDHKDIENKQFVFFKCKYCSYTSTMKDTIMVHINKRHEGEDIRILRKIETVDKTDDGKSTHESESEAPPEHTEESSKEEVVVPDGNYFKDPFSCPKCEFSSTLRINTMRHLKSHPELRPVRPTQEKPAARKTARKSTALKVRLSLSPKVTPKKGNALVQDIANAHKPIRNPFTVVKESVTATVKETVTATGSTDFKLTDTMSPSKDYYILGEQRLHSALSACFIPIEMDMKFQCRICRQKIAKRFVLHRHILDHLKIVFFKCKYCEEGAIERTLLVGHIQKEHSSKPLLYSTVDKRELESSLKERIFSQDFNDTVDLFAASTSERPVTPPDHSFKTRPVLESGDIISDSESDQSEVVRMEPEKKLDPANKYKCPKCRYTPRRQFVLNNHLLAHDDPAKKFTCSECDYRGEKFQVIKHLYNVYHPVQAHVVEDGETSVEEIKKATVGVTKPKSNETATAGESSCSSREETPDIDSTDSTQFIRNMDGKDVNVDSFRVSKAGVFEIKSMFRCKICGEKRESKSGLYHHFRSSPKCNGPFYQCSLCTFQNQTKAGIHKHGLIRHSGKKVTAQVLPKSAKIKQLKIPIKQDNQVAKMLKKRVTDNVETAPAEEIPEEKPVNSQIKCLLCKHFTCESAMRLQHHINTVHQGVPIHCQTCAYKTPLVKHMMNHCKNVHLQDEALYSDKAFEPIKKSPTPHKLEKKTEENSAKKLKLEDKVYKGNDGGQDGRVVVTCPKCNIQLSSYGTVRNHLFVHFNYKPYSCQYCKKTVSKVSNMKYHFQSVHPTKELKFAYVKNDTTEMKVNKVLKTVSNNIQRQKEVLGITRPKTLDNYELIEEGIRKMHSKLFCCDICGVKRTKLSYLRTHVEDVHPGASKKRPLEIDSDTEQPPKKLLKTVAKIKKEEVDSDNTKSNAGGKGDNTKISNKPLKYKISYDPGGEKVYQCLDCPYKTWEISNFKNHAYRCHDPTRPFYKCVYCDYQTQNVANAYRHIMNRHPKKDVRVLNLKTNEYITKSHNGKELSPARSTTSSASPARSLPETKELVLPAEVIEKVTRKVTGITTYNCHLCSLETESLFYYRLHLATHIECQYTAEMMEKDAKLFCAYCSHRGSTEFDLSLHMACHTSERKWQCLYCTYTSFERHSVLAHCRSCHGDQVENCLDRDTKAVVNGKLTLVDLDPDLKLTRVRKPLKRKKYRRIRIESDSESSDSDNEGKGFTEVQEDDVGEEKPDNELNQKHIQQPTVEDNEMDVDVQNCEMNVDDQNDSQNTVFVATPVVEESFECSEGSETDPPKLFAKSTYPVSSDVHGEGRERSMTMSFETHDFENSRLNKCSVEAGEINETEETNAFTSSEAETLNGHDLSESLSERVSKRLSQSKTLSKLKSAPENLSQPLSTSGTEPFSVPETIHDNERNDIRDNELNETIVSDEQAYVARSMTIPNDTLEETLPCGIAAKEGPLSKLNDLPNEDNNENTNTLVPRTISKENDNSNLIDKQTKVYDDNSDEETGDRNVHMDVSNSEHNKQAFEDISEGEEKKDSFEDSSDAETKKGEFEGKSDMEAKKGQIDDISEGETKKGQTKKGQSEDRCDSETKKGQFEDISDDGTNKGQSEDRSDMETKKGQFEDISDDETKKRQFGTSQAGDKKSLEDKSDDDDNKSLEDIFEDISDDENNKVILKDISDDEINKDEKLEYSGSFEDISDGEVDEKGDNSNKETPCESSIESTPDITLTDDGTRSKANFEQKTDKTNDKEIAAAGPSGDLTVSACSNVKSVSEINDDQGCSEEAKTNLNPEEQNTVSENKHDDVGERVGLFNYFESKLEDTNLGTHKEDVGHSSIEKGRESNDGEETSKDNIFEKFSEHGVSEGKVIEKEENEEVDNDKNIFDKFDAGNLNEGATLEEANTDKNEDEIEHEDGNIFEKFSAEQNIETRESEKSTVGDEDQEVDNDKNIFDKFSNISANEGTSKCSDKEKGSDVNEKGESEEKRVEDMEVDELIESIDEFEKESTKNSEEVMETD